MLIYPLCMSTDHELRSDHDVGDEQGATPYDGDGDDDGDDDHDDIVDVGGDDTRRDGHHHHNCSFMTSILWALIAWNKVLGFWGIV